MSTEQKDVLLQEYQSCHEHAEHLDKLIWQTASVIFPVTLAGLAFFGRSTTHTLDQFVVLLAVGGGSVTLLVSWYLLSRAWYSYQSIDYYRMREIETDLGLWHYRYARFIREPKMSRAVVLEGMSDEDKARLQKFEGHVSSQFTRVGMRATTTVISSIFVLGWVALIIRECFLVF